MNNFTLSALAVSVVAGSAMGATSIKSVEDLATNIVTARGTLLDSLSLGTLNGGESINGDVSGSSNDLNGDAAGGGVGDFAWSGGDDVYSLQWGGGPITIDLFFTMDGASTTNNGDLDLFLVDNPNGDDTNIGSGTSIDDNEQIAVGALAAGKYWIIVDGWAGASNSYKLAVSPTPGAAAVFGLAGLAAAGRRRRA